MPRKPISILTSLWHRPRHAALARLGWRRPAAAAVIAGAFVAAALSAPAIDPHGSAGRTAPARVSAVDTAATTGAQPAHVQARAAEVASSGRTTHAHLLHAVRKGDLLVVYVVWSSHTRVAVSDTNGNHYAAAQLGRTNWASGYGAEVFYARNAHSGATTIQVGFAARVQFGTVYVDEYDGVNRGRALVSSAARRGSGHTLQAAALRTTGARDLVYVAGASAGAVTQSSAGWTRRSARDGNLVQDRVASKQATYPATAPTSGGAWVSQTIVFRHRSRSSPPNGQPSTSPSSSSTPPSSTPPSSGPPSSSPPSVSPPTSGPPTSGPPTSGPPTTSPPPTGACASPADYATDAQCTGVPAGTNLTPYSGSCTITAANTVIDAKTMTCEVDVRAAGVVIKNSKINGRVILDTDVSGSSAWSLTLQDSEVDAGHQQLAAVSTGNLTVLRDNIHGGITAVQCEEKSVSCSVRDSYLHGQYIPAGSDWHLGGFLSDGGQNMELIHNYVVCDHPQTSIGGGCTGDINFIPNFAPISGALVQDNYLGANPDSSFCTYGGEKSTSPTPHSNHVRYLNNVFQRGGNRECAAYGPVTDFDTSQPGNEWSGNTWSDGGNVAPAN